MKKQTKMKKIIYKLTVIILLITTVSCQDVVDVDLETSKERLVIEALIQWENGTTGNEQTIKLTKTSSFYNNDIAYATGANVVVTNTNTSQVFNFTETSDGIYQVSNFVPILNNTYTLEVVYQTETYQAEETLFEAPEIIEINQSTEEGFSDEDPEINLFFQDLLDQEDFYRIVVKQFRPDDNETVDNVYFTYDAQFEENNIISGFYESDDMEPNDEFSIFVYKISERFHNFLNILYEQGDANFGPFATPPVNVRGNCININDDENYPYGYFSLNQVSKEFYVFE